jgi:CRISPR/Cas system-associated exonuclease Cas4 (RecB family)
MKGELPMFIQEVPQEAVIGTEYYQACAVEDSEEVKPHLSKSQMDKYLTCPRSHYFNNIMQIKPVRTPTNLLIGSATHRGIAAHYLARKNNEVCSLTQAIDEIWTPEITNQTPETTKELLAARNASYDYVSLFLREVDCDPVHVETSFEIPIVNIDNGDTLPCTLVGIADLVDMQGDTPRPIEIKTRASKAPEYLPSLSLELTCYAYWIWLQDQHSGNIPVGYIHIIKTKIPYIQRQEGFRDMDDFIDLFHTAKNVYDSISEGRIHKSEGMQCSWCDYLPICSRDMAETKATFGYDNYHKLWEAEFI